MKRPILAPCALSALALGCNASPSRGDAEVARTNAVVKPTIAWPAPSAIDARALAALGDATEIGPLVARSPVPVLAPSASLALAQPVVIVEAEYYAISGHAGGATIAIQGTRPAHRYDGMEPNPGNRPLRSGRGFVTVNENIRSASFVENGAGYSVDVECDDAKDARCTSDAFVVSIVESLVYVGGAGR
jgi:hypothetical protein